MPFDMIVPQKGPMRRAGADKVYVALAKVGKHATLELRVTIGGDVVELLGWTKGRTIHFGVGRAGTADQGQIALWSAEDGHFRLQSQGSRALLAVTRSLHPALSLVCYPRTVATLVQTAKERLVVKLPPCALAPQPIGEIMGDQYRRR